MGDRFWRRDCDQHHCWEFGERKVLRISGPGGEHRRRGPSGHRQRHVGGIRSGCAGESDGHRR